MPIIRSAAKRMRADRKRRARNLHVRSELATLTRKFHKLLAAGGEQVQEMARILAQRWDQAASKKIVHRKTASRKKARLARQLAKRSKS